MTREEIKDELYRMLSDVVNGGYPKRNNTQRGRYREAVKKAIKAIEQEPCEDCISRQAVLNKILKFSATDGRSVSVKGLWTEVNDLPSVTPQPKTGHWIKGKCDQCGGYAPFWPMASTYYRSKYCPNCGVRMVEPQESE